MGQVQSHARSEAFRSVTWNPPLSAKKEAAWRRLPMAERGGFEPPVLVDPIHSLSRRARSATPASLQGLQDYRWEPIGTRLLDWTRAGLRDRGARGTWNGAMTREWGSAVGCRKGQRLRVAGGPFRGELDEVLGHQLVLDADVVLHPILHEFHDPSRHCLGVLAGNGRQALDP